jgi:DNA-binding protein HU-beta
MTMETHSQVIREIHPDRSGSRTQRSETMTKTELITVIATTAGMSKRATEEVVNATFDTLAEGLKKTKRVQVPGFGTFSVRARKARSGRDPQTGAAIKIKASRTVAFKPSPNLRKGL